MNLKRFVGKSVIVTGAGFGIGRGIAQRFADEGAGVAIFDNDEKNGENTANEIGAMGGQAKFFKVDISSSADVRENVLLASREFSSVDILVNNAGIRFIKHVLEIPDEEWNRTIQVNLSGMFYAVKSVAPIMLKKGSGKIVNIASVSGMFGQTGRAAYGATKGGIIQFTRSLAVELAPTINVNAVAPGYIAGTGMMAAVDKDEKSRGWMLANSPLHRPGTPEDVASAVAFLASDEASFITGITMPVDGGFSASKYMVEGKF